jgi:hypothetical protein
MSDDEKTPTASRSRARKETTNDEPVVDSTETEEQVEDLQALREELLRLRAQVAERDKADATEAPKSGKFVIHIVNDGLTMLGKIWRRGQELEFDTDSKAYKDTCDVNGYSVLELRRNPRAQEKLYGKVMFREGPWTGKTFADMKYEALKKLANQSNDGDDVGVSLQQLTELEELDAKRRSKPEPLPPLIEGGHRLR